MACLTVLTLARTSEHGVRDWLIAGYKSVNGAAIFPPGLGGCQRNATPAASSPRTARQRQGTAGRTATDAPYGPRCWACLTVRQMCGSERTNRKI